MHVPSERGTMEVSLLNGLRVLGASLIYYSIKLGILGLEGFRELRISYDPTSVSCSSTLDVEPSTLAAIKRNLFSMAWVGFIVVRRVAFRIHITP